MTGSEAMRKRFKIEAHLQEELADLVAELANAGQQWEGLGKVGGQRDDHAAKLLERTALHLRRIESFAGRCADQICELQENPFGDPDRMPAALADAVAIQRGKEEDDRFKRRHL